MKRYRHKSITSDGRMVSGTVTASTQADAHRILTSNGLTIRSLTDSSAIIAWMTGDRIFGRAKLKHRVEILNSLAAGAAAEMPFLATLEMAMRGLPRRSAAHKALERVITAVRDGMSPEAAMNTVADHLGTDMAAVYSAASRTQDPEKALLRMAEIIEQGGKIGSAMRSAMIQPGITMLALLGAAVMVVLVALPSMAGIYEDFDAELPLATRILMSISDFMTNNSIQTMLGSFLSTGAAMFAWIHPSSRLVLSKAGDKIPVIGKTRSGVTVQRLSSMIGLLLDAEIPQTDIMEITARAVPSKWVSRSLRNASKDIPEMGFAAAIERHLTPLEPILGVLARQSEQLGSDPGSPWARYSSMHSHSTERRVMRLADTLQPILMLVAGSVLMLVALAVYAPMFGMIDVMTQAG